MVAQQYYQYPQAFEIEKSEAYINHAFQLVPRPYKYIGWNLHKEPENIRSFARKVVHQDNGYLMQRVRFRKKMEDLGVYEKNSLNVKEIWNRKVGLFIDILASISFILIKGLLLPYEYLYLIFVKYSKNIPYGKSSPCA